LIYAVLAVFCYSRYVFHLDEKIPGGADGVLYAWFFQGIEHSIVHGHNPLYLPDMNAPNGVNTMWNTAVLVVAVICLPLTATLGAPVTVTLLMVLSPVISASCAYYVIRRLTGTTAGAALAALIYGFGPYFVGQNGHLHLTLAFFPPLLLLLGYEMIVRQTARRLRLGLLLGVLTAVALLCGEEVVAVAAVIAVFSTIVLALLYVGEIRARARYGLEVIGIGAVAAIVLTGYPLWFQFFGPQALSRGPSTGGGVNVASLVRPGELLQFATSADIAANDSYTTLHLENTGYLGWPLVVALVAVLIWTIVKRDRIGLWWWLSGAVTLCISLGATVWIGGTKVGPGIWTLLNDLPTLGTVLVVRFSLLTSFFVAFGLAWTIRSVRDWRPSRQVVAWVAVAACLIPLTPAAPYRANYQISTPAFFTDPAALKVIPANATVLLMPNGRSANESSVNMMWQLRADMRFDIVGGYAVFNDHGHASYRSNDPDFVQVLRDAGTYGTLPTAAELAAARPSMTSTGLDDIVITDQQPHSDVVIQAAAALTGCQVRTVADVVVCSVP
jgi:hypothetical protein